MGQPNMTEVLIKTGNLDKDMYRGKAVWRPREKAAMYKPKKEVLEGNNPTETLISNF